MSEVAAIRGRRRRRRPGRGFAALLPHLLTTGNLAAGFYAIVTAPTDLDRAAAAVFVAMIFDFLDGRAARLARATSRFGVEYDSISDTVSFGVAPAVMAFSAGTMQELGWTGWVLAFMFTSCAGLRLARFNVAPARFPGCFDGLPSPAAAGMVAASVFLTTTLRESGWELGAPPAMVGFGLASLGLLMVSPIPYRSFKDLDLRGSYSTVVIAVVTVGVIGLKPSVTFPVIGILYVLSGPVEWLYRWWKGCPREPLPVPDTIAAEDTPIEVEDPLVAAEEAKE